jgi:hypothetical protein
MYYINNFFFNYYIIYPYIEQSMSTLMSTVKNG